MYKQAGKRAKTAPHGGTGGPVPHAGGPVGELKKILAGI